MNESGMWLILISGPRGSPRGPVDRIASGGLDPPVLGNQYYYQDSVAFVVNTVRIHSTCGQTPHGLKNMVTLYSIGNKINGKMRYGEFDLDSDWQFVYDARTGPVLHPG